MATTPSRLAKIGRLSDAYRFAQAAVYFHASELLREGRELPPELTRYVQFADETRAAWLTAHGRGADVADQDESPESYGPRP